jgi:hypothetical protein
MQSMQSMRSRWPIWVTGAVLALAIAFLYVRPRPDRLVVSVLYETNSAPTLYVVQVANMTEALTLFTAWSEYQTNGMWKRVDKQQKPALTLKPTETQTFTLPKPTHGKARIAVLYKRVSRSRFEQWRDRFNAQTREPPKSERMYIDVP